MPRENCPFAYHKQCDISVHCTKAKKPFDYCAHTYYCTQSHRYEATKVPKQCPLKTKE